MSTSAETAKKLVAAGGSFLDLKRNGNWRAEINKDTLDLASPRYCIVGQLYGEYDDGLGELGISNPEARKYGFESGYSDNTYVESSDLTNAWKAYLTEVAHKGVTVGTILNGVYSAQAALKVISGVTIGGDLYWISEEGRLGTGQYLGILTAPPAVHRASTILESWKVWTPAKVEKGKFYVFTSNYDTAPSVWYAQTDDKLWKMLADGATWISAANAEKKSDFRELETSNGNNFNQYITK